MDQINIVTIFLTGLLAGGVSCVAVQGGLLISTLAQSQEEELKKKTKSSLTFTILVFLISKLIAYTLLGVFLGWIGSFFAVSIAAEVIMLSAVSIFMLGTAFNILNIHPVFKYFVIQPPAFLTKLIKKQAKSKEIFAPAILGALTIFIPCGITQAMLASAIASASPFWGAAILFAFVLGTSPVFFVLGYFITKMGEIFKERFLKIVAILIIILALFNINNAFALSGNPLRIDETLHSLQCTFFTCDDTVSEVSQVSNNQTIEITDSGYLPSEIWVKAGEKVTLELKNIDARGCIQAFTIPAFNIKTVIPTGSSQIITLNPESTGDINFMCSMGMYRGIIHVTK